ncbi:hypothetical protein LOTGIDRAFT_157661 [Lottia gigantea]|uniref:Uncharacterized protein n=1 Tax=Lottia gigantea TaxID=225164 RepID=V4B5X0_LOTGI|nr:hypothetical protein LOTGIDRAFT_157661 [Lottia gigantea]ESP01472.1 hypothetical protein LOTGIDRAFT_157661 [Lottia gigantea]
MSGVLSLCPFVLGSLLADDDGSPSLARAAGSHRGSMDRTGYPQEADKKRLHQLFESFRSNTNDSDSNASVKHVSCRRRRDSGSSSSSEEDKKRDKSNLYKSVCDSITSSEPGLIPSRPTSETESALNSPVAKPSRLNSKPIETTVPPELTNGNSRNLRDKAISSDTVSQSSSSENARFSSTESGQNAKRIESKIQQTNQMSNLCPPSASPRQNVRLSPEHSNMHLRKGSGQSDTSSISSARTASPATKMRLLDLASTRALERDGSDGSDNDDSHRSRKNKKHSISTWSRECQTVSQYEEGFQYHLKSQNLDTTAFEASYLDGTGSDSFFSLKLDVGLNHDTKNCMLNFGADGYTDSSTCMLKHNNHPINETYCLSQSSSNSGTLDSLHAPSPYCPTTSALQHFNTPSAQNSDVESIEDTCTHFSLAESLSSELYYTPVAYLTSDNNTTNTNTKLHRSSISDLSPVVKGNSKVFQESQQLTSCNKTFIIDREDIPDSFDIVDAVTEEEDPDQKCSKYVLDIKEYVNIDDEEYDSDLESKDRQLGETYIYGEADQLLTDLENDSEVSFLTSPHIDFNAIHKPVPKHAYPITDTDEVSDNLSVISETTEPDNSSLSDLASNYQDENDDIDELANKSIDVLFDDQYDLPITKFRSPRLKKKSNRTPTSTRKHVSFSEGTIFKQETNLQSDVPKQLEIPIMANYKEVTSQKEGPDNVSIGQTASLVKDEEYNLKETITNTHHLSSNLIQQEISPETETNSSKIKSPIVVLNDDVPNIAITEDLEQSLPVEKVPSDIKVDMKNTVNIPDSQRNKPSSGAKYSRNGSKLKVQKFMKKVKKNSPRSSPVEELESDSNSASSIVDSTKPTEANSREQKSPLPRRRKQNTKISTPNSNERTKSIHIEKTKSAQIEQKSKNYLRSECKDLKVKPKLTNSGKDMESYRMQSSTLKVSLMNQSPNLATKQDLHPNDVVPDSCPNNSYNRCQGQLQRTVTSNKIEQTQSTTPMELPKDRKKPPKINYQYLKEVQSSETDSGNENHQEIFSFTIDKLKWKSNMQSVNNDCDKHSKRELSDENYVNLMSRDLNSHQNPGKTVNDILIVINQADEVKIPRTIRCDDGENNELKNCDETYSNSVSIASDINNQTVPNDFEISTKSCDKWKGIEMKHSKTDVFSCESGSMEVTSSESCGDHLDFEIKNNNLDIRENLEEENISNELAIKRITDEFPNTDISLMQAEDGVQTTIDFIPNMKKSEISREEWLQTVQNQNINKDGCSVEIIEDSKCELSKDYEYDITVPEMNDFKNTLPVDISVHYSKNDGHMPNAEVIMENQDLSLKDLKKDECNSTKDLSNSQKYVNTKHLVVSIKNNQKSELCEKLLLESIRKYESEQESDPNGNDFESNSMSGVPGDVIQRDSVKCAEISLEVEALPTGMVNNPLIPSLNASIQESNTLNPSHDSDTESQHPEDSFYDYQCLNDSKQITLQYSTGEESNKSIYSNNTGYCVIEDNPISTTTNLHCTNPNINSDVAMDTNKMLPKVKEGPENASKQDQAYPSSPTTGESPNMDNSSRQLTQTIPDIHIVSSSSLPKATVTGNHILVVHCPKALLIYSLISSHGYGTLIKMIKFHHNILNLRFI